MDIVEPYHPDRVLRQFGGVQRIPPTPLAPQRATRGATANQYRIAYNYLDQIWERFIIQKKIWERWHNHLLSPMERGVLAAHPWDCAPNYMEWFLRMSHPIIQNPEHRSTFNPRNEDSQGSPSMDPRLRIVNAQSIIQAILRRGHSLSVRDPDALYVALEDVNRVLDGADPADLVHRPPRSETHLQSQGETWGLGCGLSI